MGRDDKELMKMHQFCTKVLKGMYSNGALLPAENGHKSPAANQHFISCSKGLQNHMHEVNYRITKVGRDL